MTTKNPWRGLASYEEPQGTSDDYLFCGRDEETLEVVRLIDNNLFITLYGSSGIGKTSLLKAGVMPILKRRDYYPLYVRLSQEPTEIPYAEAIVRRLQSSGLKEERGIEMVHVDSNDRLYLWNYFATTRFRNAEGREVYPVIILDQFEEVFRDADKRKAEFLLQQIYLLLNDELEMPNQEGYNDETNYRFVASIREDFLFVLEDSIDEFSLDLYKNNRYRLRPMKPEQARQVIKVPGKDCIEENEKEKVIERVIELSKNGSKNVIDTLLLSLVCACTFDRNPETKLTHSIFEFWGNNPMRVYYQEAIRPLCTEHVRSLQQNLVNKDGSRNRVEQQTILKSLGEAVFENLLRGPYRILTLTSEKRVELLHDQLALVIFEDRDAYEERERNWKYMEMQSRFVAEKAKSVISDNSYLARLLAVEILPKNIAKPERPYTAEAEMALREACDHETAVLIGHMSSVHQAAYSHDGKKIVSASRDKTIMIWDAKTGAVFHTINNHNDVVSSVSFSPDDKFILSASWDKTLKLFDSESYSLLKTFVGHKAPVLSAAFSPNGKYVVSSSQDNIIIFWDIKTGKQIETITEDSLERPKDYLPIAYSPNGEHIIYVSKGNTIVLWNTCTRKAARFFDGHINQITSVSFSPNGKHIVSSSYDKTIKIWNTKTGRLEKTLLGHKSRVLSVAFSQDSKHIVSASHDNMIKIWNAKNGEEEMTLQGHEAKIYSIAFSPNGNNIISASRDNTVRLWESLLFFKNVSQDNESYSSLKEIETYDRSIIKTNMNSIFLCDIITGEMISTFTGHSHRIVSASFSPDGKFVVSVSREGTIKVWCVKDQSLLWSFNTHSKKIKSVCFSPDGSRIIAATYGGATSAWSFPLPLQELIDQTRERFKDRPLTPEERRMYYLE